MTRFVSIGSEPLHDNYDVVIVGGAMIGSSIAWWLMRDADFDGTVLVVDRDMSFEHASTSHTNSCIRQQFSTEVNVRISQFGADFIRNFRRYLGGDPEVPDLEFDTFGYMYLAVDEAFAHNLRANRQMQHACGAATRLLGPDELLAEYPFYNVDDIVCASHNPVDEGYFDGGTMFSWLRRKARELGAEYVEAEVCDIELDGDRVIGVVLESGQSIGCGTVVNASGPRAASTALMAGLHVPVEPRKRYTFVFDCAERLSRRLPLTIDPSGVHMRSDGDAYMAGCAPDLDHAVDPDDFGFDQAIFEEKVWPALVHRVPAFERIKVTARWTGHYAYNRLDQNAIVGPHTDRSNLLFACGFTGHGLQQAPAVGRGIAELIVHGAYRSLDLSPLGWERVLADRRLVERAVI